MTVATDPRKTGVNAGMTLLAASAVAAGVTGTLVETTLATVTIPAGAMGLNGGVMYRAKFSRTNNANAHQMRVRWGGVAGTVSSSTSSGSSGAAQIEGEIRNRNSVSSQLLSAAGAGFIAAGTAWLTDTLNTAGAIDLVFTGQLATSTADTVTLESYEVWLLP